MKLIIAGSTGFVGTELVRQALSLPSITSVVALSRRTTPVPSSLAPNADLSKLKSVACEDFGNYSDEVKKELSNADACIWTIALTPSRYRAVPWDEAVRICSGYAVYALETISKLSDANRPFKFVYFSGSSAVRDPAQKPLILGDYLVMRGEAENKVLKYAAGSNGKVEACILKPGLITAPGKTNIVVQALATVGRALIGLPKIDVGDLSSALLSQIVRREGFEKDTLFSEDMERIAKAA
ncbi:hypothetical protein QBC35DRAFT_387055 [Podospora australis]|uniref:NAD(P)-binding domain-containing protein n=1 Tax=Podospora australis TaxID=1536484 RepID=A0AAN7AGL6_9PEZI|nr:hypothetical protein QBC35DRAFT_387055 [Podospora australis]